MKRRTRESIWRAMAPNLEKFLKNRTKGHWKLYIGIMVKHLDPKISSLSFDKEDHPGCLWGVLHVLRSYQWNNVKRMMPNKKSGGSRKQAASIRYSRLRSNNPDTSEAQVSIDVDEDDMNMREMLSSPSHNRSRKARGSMHSLPSFRAHFVRTDSIHHLDPSSHMLPDEIRECGPLGCKWNPHPPKTSGPQPSCCNNGEACPSTSSMKDMSPSQLDELGRQLIDNAILQNKLERSRESLSRKKLLVANKSRRDITVCQPKEVLDTLETIDLNSEKSQKHLLNSSYSLGHHLNAIHDSNSKRGLTKSESFPVDVASNRNSLTPRKLHKMQTEAGYFDDTAVDVLKQNQESQDITSTNSSSVRLELKKRSFKNIRRKIKNAIKESKKERHRICMDAIFHKVPYGSRFTKDFKRGVSNKLKKSVFYRSEKKKLRNNYDTNSLTAIVSNSGLSSIRRTKSLNESLDRYSQLLELTTDREPKHSHSASLKLANESGASSLGTSPNPLGRVMSLPILDLYQCGEAVFSGLPTTNTEGSYVSQSEQEMRQDMDGNAKQAHPSPISVLDSCFQEDISTPTKISILEGIESELGKVLVDEVNLEKLKLSSRNLTPDFQHVQVDKKNEAGFNYVKDILKLSGFTGHESLGTWFSPEQPVNPSLFEEVETSSPLKSDYSGDEENTSYDHQLLFDMINEVLLEIHEKSFTYWPLALSSNCHIRPRPSGSYVLEEVWRIISWYLNSQPEFEPLDYLVVRDLSKNDGWMNLQLDSECVGLELEQMIMDDLLDEMVYE